jgi:hypothetical protein
MDGRPASQAHKCLIRRSRNRTRAGLGVGWQVLDGLVQNLLNLDCVALDTARRATGGRFEGASTDEAVTADQAVGLAPASACGAGDGIGSGWWSRPG